MTDKKPSTYIIEIPYHKETPKKDVEELLNCLSHCMEKADMLSSEDSEFSDLFWEVYELLAEAFFLMEPTESKMSDQPYESMKNNVR